MVKRTCSVEGCFRPVVARGWCRAHYLRAYKTRDLQIAVPVRAATEAERFWAKVSLGPGCWLWTGAISSNGYGSFGGFALAHRYSYEMLVGPIPAGLQLDHLCRERRCVNPAHLEPVTAAENMRRRRIDVCARGHSMADAYIRPDTGRRRCHQCMLDYARARRARASA